MFQLPFTTRKQVGSLKISLKNIFALSSEKVSHTPRVFDASQIKSATENIMFENTGEAELPAIIFQSLEYLLKDLFLQMHQTGLYNRQLKLWKSLASLTEAKVFKLQQGIFKKTEVDIYFVDLFIDPKSPCVSLVIDTTAGSDTFDAFKAYVNKAIPRRNKHRCKGVFYFSNQQLSDDFVMKLKSFVNAYDSISRYESLISGTQDIRLNIVHFNQEGEKFVFKLISPELTYSRDKKLTTSGAL